MSSVGDLYENDALPKYSLNEDRLRKKDESGKSPGSISSHSFHCNSAQPRGEGHTMEEEWEGVEKSSEGCRE